jgi:photosystem II stability/assembly factor-like uncharacterized protein
VQEVLPMDGGWRALQRFAVPVLVLATAACASSTLPSSTQPPASSGVTASSPAPSASGSASSDVVVEGLRCPRGPLSTDGAVATPAVSNPVSPTLVVPGLPSAGLLCQYGSEPAPETSAVITGDLLTNVRWQVNNLQPLCTPPEQPAQAAVTTDVLLFETSGATTEVSVVLDPGCHPVSSVVGIVGYAGPKLLAQLALLTGAASSVPPVSPTDAPPQSYSGPEAIAFPTASHGVMLGLDCPLLPGNCDTFTEVSDDGGLTWSEPTVLASAAWSTPGNPPTNWLAAGQLAFSSSHIGYAYGPDLYQTVDGGRTWHQLSVDGQVGELAAAPDSAWMAVEHGCDVACTGWQLDTVGADGVVQAAERQPLKVDAPPGANGVGVPQLLLRPTADTAYLGGFRQLEVTHDGGVSWERASYPCAGGIYDHANVAASGTSTLVAACAGEMGWGAERKQSWTSSDSGTTWHGPTTLEEMGYSDQVTAASATVVWRYGDRGNLFRSSDSGRTWRPMLTTDFEEGFGAPTGFAALGSERAWVLDPYGPYWTGQRYLYITADAGKTWRTVDVLDNLAS